MKANLKIALRNLYREKTYALLNIAGLALAVTCCLIIGLYLHSELTYDRHNVNHKNIYRVVNEFTTSGKTDRTAFTSDYVGRLLKANYPEVKEYVHFFTQTNNNLLMRHEDKAYYWDNSFIATDNVFRVFTHDIIYGDPDTALADTNSIAVSESFARKYFGDENPLDKIMYSESGAARRITLVFGDLPENSHVKYDVLFSFNNNPFSPPDNVQVQQQLLWQLPRLFTYVLMEDGFDARDYERINADFYARFMEPFGGQDGKNWRSWLQPLADIHLYSDVGSDLPTGNRFYLFGFAAVGAFILLVACINYINLATARATKRAKTVGMRKILGASRASLMLQFLAEGALFALAATILGIAITEIALSLSPLNTWIGKSLELDVIQNPELLLGVLGLGLLVGLLASIYPALYLSSWAPLAAMIGRNTQGKSNTRFRQILVFFQFCISIAVIASTLLMAAQMRFINDKPLGFDKENRILITLRGADLIEKVPSIIKDLSTQPGILGISTSSIMMGQIFTQNDAQVEVENSAPQTTRINSMFVGDDFLQVMGIELAAGRDFTKKLLTDVGSSYIVNESFVRQMGWDNAIGKTITFNGRGRVIGVVKDFHFQSLHSSLNPLVIGNFQDDFSGMPELNRRIMKRLMLVNISGDNIGETLRILENKFAEVDASHPFVFEFVDTAMDNLYRAEKSMMRLISLFAGICILIACMGLFGLAVFTTAQRTKEIGIRKTLGASTSQIILMLARNVLLMIIAGALVASALAYLAIDEWLAAFAYRAPINPLIFLIATLVAALVAYVTIALQSYRTASADPVGSLRYE